MKVRVIQRFYDAKTKKPYRLRKVGEIYNPSKARAEGLAKAENGGPFVQILEEEIEQPVVFEIQGTELETKGKGKGKDKGKSSKK